MASSDDDFDLDNEFGFDDGDLENDEFGPDQGPDEGSRSPVSRIPKGVLEGAIGTATDNEMIKDRVKNALPDSLARNWETADDIIDIADGAKDKLVNPIRKEMVSFKRNVNKLTPLVSKYLGTGVGGKFNEWTKTRPVSEEVDPDTQELTQAVGGIFNEEAKARVESENKKLVLDMMQRQTEEDRFKLQMTTMHDTMSAVRRMDDYNRAINYNFQQKTLEYDIKRFHLLRQLLTVTKEVGEKSVAHLQTITHNTSLPDLVKQQSSELFQQMFVEKWYGDTVESVQGMSRNMLRNLGKNILNRAGNTASSVVDTMRTIGDTADMVAGMSEGMDMDEDIAGEGGGSGNRGVSKQLILEQLARTTGSGVVKKGIDSLIYELRESTKDTDWFNNLVAQSDNLAQNQNQFLRKVIEDSASAEGGIKGALAPLFKIIEEELPDTKRAMTSIGQLNDFKPNDPRQWSHSDHLAQIEIIPGWLEKIHNLLSDFLGKGEDLTYDEMSGDFVDKSSIVQQILDRVTTDDERTEAIEEVDKFIDFLTKDIQNVGEDARHMLREFIIREASTTADWDMKNLADVNAFKGLNTYDETLASTVSTAFDNAYDMDNMYKITGDSLQNREENKRLSKVKKSFKAVGRHYKDDQEVLNEMITSGRRRLLRDANLLNEDGSINELGILKHKLGGMDDDAPNGLAQVIRNASNPPSVPATSPPPSGPVPPQQNRTSQDLAANTQTYDTGGSTSSSDSLPTSNPPQWNFNIDDVTTGIDAAVSELIGINSNTNTIIAELKRKAVGPAGFMSPQVATSSLSMGDRSTNDYLAGILSMLATMHQANVSYYQNVNDFEANRHGFGQKVKDLLGKGADKVGGAFGFVLDKYKSLFNIGHMSTKALQKGFQSRFSFDAADVYVGGETSPRIIASDFRNKVFLQRRPDGEIIEEPIRNPDDIKFEVIKVDGENITTIITQEEIDNGLVNINREGVMKRIGGMLGGLSAMGFNAADSTINLASLSWKLTKGAVKFAGDAIHRNFLKFKDVYLLDENGKPKLLAKMDELRDGKLFYMDGDRLRVVQSMSDLLKGDIYRMGADGETPECVGTMEELKGRFTDFYGKAIESSTGVIDKVIDFAKKGASGAIGLAKLPFTVFGNVWSKLKAKFESNTLEKIVLNIPKDILISANVVYLNDKGRGHDPRKTSISEPTNAEHGNDTKVSAADKLLSTIAKYDNKGRTAKVRALYENVSNDPRVLSEMVRKEYNKRVAKDGEGISEEEFTKEHLKSKLGNKWEEVHNSIKDLKKEGLSNVGKNISDKLSGNEKVKSIKKKLGVDNIPEGVSVKDAIMESSLASRAKESKLGTMFSKAMTPTTGSEMNRTYDKLTGYGKKKQADKYFEKLKNDPETLRDVINDAWRTHLKNSDSPVDKDAFRDQWLVDKFGIDAPSVLEMLEEADMMDISEMDTKRIGNIKDVARNAFMSSNLGKRLGKVSISNPLKTIGHRAEDGEVGVEESSSKTFGGKGLSELTALMKNRWKTRDAKEAKDSKGVRGDTDGDGIRENSWQDILKDRARVRSIRPSKESDRVEDPKEKKSKGLMGLLIAGIGSLVGIMGKAVAGVGTLTKGLANLSWLLGKGLVKGIAEGVWKIGVPLITSLLKGGGAVLGAANSVLGAAAGKVIDKVKSVATPVINKVKTKAGAIGARVVTRAIPAALAMANPIGIAIGVASAGWAIWEASNAAWEWFDRRSDIKMMEYLRHLEYGMVSGDEGYQHKNKISLRYFESKIIGEAVIKDGMIEIGMSSAEVWDEFRYDFEDDGRDNQRTSFIKWYEGRFLPVLYKWMSLCHTFNAAYKAQQDESFLGSKDDLTLSEMDDKLSKELKAGIAKQSLNYGQLKHDPLEVMDSPSTTVITTMTRVDAVKFTDQIIANLKGERIDSDNPTVVDQGQKVKDAHAANAAQTSQSSKWRSGYEATAMLDTGETPSNFTMSRNPNGGYTVDKNLLNQDVTKMDYIDFIKSKEGFHATSFWDHKQHSIGYGTRATKAEVSGNKAITEQEAERRLKEHVDLDRDNIIRAGEQEGLSWTERELDALTSFTYNLGLGNLRKLIKGRDKNQIAQAMPLYSKASGKVLPGLVKRRNEEVLMFKAGQKAANDSQGNASNDDLMNQAAMANATSSTTVKDLASKESTGTSVVNKADITPADAEFKELVPKESINPVDSSNVTSITLPPKPTVGTSNTADTELSSEIDKALAKSKMRNEGMVEADNYQSEIITGTDNKGVEDKVSEGNTIAAKSLDEQTRLNDNMEKFFTYLDGVVGGDTVPTNSSTDRSTSSPKPPMTSVVTPVPASKPRASTSAKYK